MDIIETVSQQVARRQEILDCGVGLADLDEYNVLTLKLAEAVPTLVRAIKNVIVLHDELVTDESTVFAVSHAFAAEIVRALKGQRPIKP